MKKIFFTILSLLVVTLTLTACINFNQEQATLDKIKERDKLIVGVKTDSKPFGYKNEKGEIVGYDVDLAKKIAENILGDPNKIELVEVTSSNRIMKLTSGEVDILVSSFTINPQRKKVVNFSTPYYATGQALMVKKGSKIKTFADLDDKTIGVVIGTTAEQNIKEFAPRAIIRSVKTYQELYDLLKSGKVEVITSDAEILRGFEMDDSEVVLLSGRYTKEYYGIAFRKDEESESLQEAVDGILNKLNTTNFLVQLGKTWISDEKW